MRPLGKTIVATLALAGIGLIVAGGWLVVQRDAGTRARARVTDCVGSGGLHNARTDCTATWVVGGSLVGGNGHVVLGLAVLGLIGWGLWGPRSARARRPRLS
jgi:hypothetical protein